MADAVVARDQGGDYQARFFWLQACRLFQSHTKVARVAYELNRIKSFDDVVVTYKEPISLERGDVVETDYFQVKFHVSQAGSFTYQSLVDPKFINATRFSLLQKLHSAQKSSAQNGGGARFILVSPWIAHPDDPLAQLISNNGGEIRLQVLFDGTGTGSKMGKVRFLWRSHLQLSDDNELAAVLRPLRVKQGADSLANISDLLNLHLSLSGMAPVEAGQLVNPYDDLIRKLLAQGQNEFTREQLQEILVRENLWRGVPARAEKSPRIGIRSFMRWAEHMEDETEEMLDFVKHFDNRNIRERTLWNGTILPEVNAFLSKYGRSSKTYHLLLDTHSSIAFAAGYSVEAKSGADLVPVQRTRSGRVAWRAEITAEPPHYPGWLQTEHPCGSTGHDVVVAISVTHDVTEDVDEFVKNELPEVGRIIICKVESGPSQSAIFDGTHALMLAQKIAALVKRRTREERAGVLHIFAAAPNAFMFFLGQTARGFGRCMLYEYDFDSNALGAYSPSIAFPDDRLLSTKTSR